MKKISMACLVILLAGAVTSGSVLAWGGGGNRGGGHFGGGFGGGYGGGHYGGGYHHGGAFGGFGIGIYGLGYGPGYYSGYPYYGGGYYAYPPAVVTVPTSPPVYIQQSPPVTQQYQSGYWYYCTNPEGYYPYIKECLNTWQQVDPRPPATR